MDTRDSTTISSTPTPQKKFIAKVVVLGDVNVGKSNIIRRILGEEFQELEATIGVEFGYYNVPDIDPDDPSVSLNLQIWDTSGAERYRAITTSHIRNADGAILVYDITTETSFSTLDFWYDAIKKATRDNIVIYLLGNKSDLIRLNPANRKVERERALEFVMRYNIFFWSECSAKDNTNILETFKSFYKSVFVVQKDKLEEKTKDLKKVFESKRQDPKMKCCV